MDDAARFVEQSDCFRVFAPNPATLTVDDPEFVVCGINVMINPFRLGTDGLGVGHV
jgi:hypothetical protein